MTPGSVLMWTGVAVLVVIALCIAIAVVALTVAAIRGKLPQAPQQLQGQGVPEERVMPYGVGIVGDQTAGLYKIFETETGTVLDVIGFDEVAAAQDAGRPPRELIVERMTAASNELLRKQAEGTTLVDDEAGQ